MPLVIRLYVRYACNLLVNYWLRRHLIPGRKLCPLLTADKSSYSANKSSMTNDKFVGYNRQPNYMRNMALEIFVVPAACIVIS